MRYRVRLAKLSTTTTSSPGPPRSQRWTTVEGEDFLALKDHGDTRAGQNQHCAEGGPLAGVPAMGMARGDGIAQGVGDRAGTRIRPPKAIDPECVALSDPCFRGIGRPVTIQTFGFSRRMVL